MQTHQMRRVGAFDPTLGQIYAIVADEGVNGFFLQVQPEEGAERLKLVHHGRVVHEYVEESPHVALSYDGLHLAWIRRNHERKIFEIVVNGIVRHTTDVGDVSHLVWLDGGRLAWEGRGHFGANEDEIIKASRTFYVDGEAQDPSFEFQIVGSSTGRHAVYVRRGEDMYRISSDGKRGPTWKPEWDPRFYDEKLPPTIMSILSHGIPRSQRRETEKPLTIRSEDGRWTRVSFRGVYGPDFEKIQHDCVSRDGLNLAYAGERNDGFLAKMGAKLSASWLWGGWWVGSANRNKPTVARMAFALLYNPYFGPLHLMQEMDVRTYVVHNHKPWPKPYVRVYALEFAPSGKLVALVSDDRSTMMAIDGVEGPGFDRITQYCVHEDGRLVYLAMKGSDIYRVEVRV